MLNESEILKCLMDWRSRLSGAVWLIVKDAHAAEDVFQNVALKAITKDVAFENESALVSWAFIAARREGIDWLRRNGRLRTGPDDELLVLINREWEATRDTTSPGPRMEALASCLESLPERSRSLLAWRYHEGRNCAEIAGCLGIALNAVYKRLSRLHQELRQCVERKLADRRPIPNP